MARLVTMAMVMCLLATGCGKPDWKGFTSTEGRFTVLFPRTPKQESTNGSLGVTTSFKAEFSGASYSISFRDMSVRDNWTITDFKKYWKEKNWKVTAENEWVIEDTKGWELEARSNDDEKLYYSGRSIDLGNRHYEAKVVGTDAQLSNPSVRTFLNSFVPFKKRSDN